jgi:hypothetical protein
MAARNAGCAPDCHAARREDVAVGAQYQWNFQCHRLLNIFPWKLMESATQGISVQAAIAWHYDVPHAPGPDGHVEGTSCALEVLNMMMACAKKANGLQWASDWIIDLLIPLGEASKTLLLTSVLDASSYPHLPDTTFLSDPCLQNDRLSPDALGPVRVSPYTLQFEVILTVISGVAHAPATAVPQ